jgi:hypothetical protein
LKFLFLNFEKENGHRKWKNWKKIDFEIWIEILKYVTKIWNEKIEIFHFWNLKWKFLFNFF